MNKSMILTLVLLVDTQQSGVSSSSFAVNTSTPVSVTSMGMLSGTPTLSKHASVRSALRGPSAPSSGRSVRFFSRTATRMITPNTSAAEESSAEGHPLPLTAMSLDLPREFDGQDYSHLSSKHSSVSEFEGSFMSASSPNLPSQVQNIPPHPIRSSSSPNSTFSSELVPNDPFARPPPNVSTKTAARTRSAIPVDFFTPPRASSSPCSKTKDINDSDHSSFSLPPIPSIPSNHLVGWEDLDSIPMVNDDSEVLLEKSIELEYSGEIDPAHFFNPQQPTSLSLRAHTTGHFSANSSSSDVSRASSTAQHFRRPTSLDIQSNTSDALQMDDTTQFHSIMVTSPTSEMRFSAAEHSSLLLPDPTPERHSARKDPTAYFTPNATTGRSSRSKHNKSSSSFDSISVPSFLVAAQEELISDLRSELSLQHDITQQFEADLSSRDELVEILAERLQSAERSMCSFKVQLDKRDDKLRMMKSDIHEMQKKRQWYQEAYEKTRSEKMNRSLLDQASGAALGALHMQKNQLQQANSSLTTSLKDMEVRLEAEREEKARLEAALQELRDGGLETSSWVQEREGMLEVQRELQDAVDLLKMEHTALTNTSNQQQTTITEKEKENKNLVAEVEAQWANTERTSTVVKNLEKGKRDLEVEVGVLRQRLEEATHWLEEAKHQLEEVNQRLEETDQRLEEANQRLEEVTSEAEELKIENTRIMHAAQQWEEEAETQRNLKEELTMRLEELEDVVEERDHVSSISSYLDQYTHRKPLVEERGRRRAR